MIDEDELKLIAFVGELVHDPLRYVKAAYPWGVPGTELANKKGPKKWQRRILQKIGDDLRGGAKDAGEVIRIAVASGHGIGKSALIAWLNEWALATQENTRCVVTANTEKQLITKTWPEIAKWHRMSMVRHWFTLTATALYSSDASHEKNWRSDAVAWSEHNTEAFAGLHNAGYRLVVLFDEASKIADKVWEVTEGALTDADTEILWVVFGNPTRASGRFRECFRRFRHRWYTENIDAREVEDVNEVLHAQWIEDHGVDSDFVKIRVRGMFPSASTRSLISEELVDKGWGLHLRPNQYEFAPTILSVDPAWEGDDMLVIAARTGLWFRILEEIPKNDNDIAVAQKVAYWEDELKADAVFIDGGYGTGIVSAGRSWGREWTLVWFAEKPQDPGCLNKRVEMWDQIPKWLRAGGSIPMHDGLRQDLLGVELVPRVDGLKQLESKKEMKARGLPSPNYGDALALTFAYPVVKREWAHAGGAGMTSDYDPFGDN